MPIRNNLWAIGAEHIASDSKIYFERHNRGSRYYRNVSETSRRRFERHFIAFIKEDGTGLEVIIASYGLYITAYL